MTVTKMELCCSSSILIMKLVLVTFVFFVISAKKNKLQTDNKHKESFTTVASAPKSQSVTANEPVFMVGWRRRLEVEEYEKCRSHRVWWWMRGCEQEMPVKLGDRGVNKRGIQKGGHRLPRSWSYSSAHKAFCMVEWLIIPFFLKLVLGWIEQLHSCRIPFLIHSLSWRASLYARIISFPNRVNY